MKSTGCDPATFKERHLAANGPPPQGIAARYHSYGYSFTAVAAVMLPDTFSQVIIYDNLRP